MALHRDIHWIGRQWAVTGYGMQAIDQRHGGQFDIEIAGLWDDHLLERLSGQKWSNPEDFAKGLAIARKRYPGTPRALEPEPEFEPEPEPESKPEPEFEAAPASEPEPVSAPPSIHVAPPLPVSDVTEPPPKTVELLEPKTPKAEPPMQVQAPAPEDLLAKWFEAYGLNKTPSSEAGPKPTRDVVALVPVASAPQPSEPIATVEPALMKESPVIESAGSQPPAPSILQMPIPGSARFVRPWRVPIHAVQSYKL
jgi:hypothetical protein